MSVAHSAFKYFGVGMPYTIHYERCFYRILPRLFSWNILHRNESSLCRKRFIPIRAGERFWASQSFEHWFTYIVWRSIYQYYSELTSSLDWCLHCAIILSNRTSKKFVVEFAVHNLNYPKKWQTWRLLLTRGYLCLHRYTW